MDLLTKHILLASLGMPAALQPIMGVNILPLWISIPLIFVSSYGVVNIFKVIFTGKADEKEITQ